MCYYGYGVIGLGESVEFVSCAILGLGLRSGAHGVV